MNDRERWNRKYGAGEHTSEKPSRLLRRVAARLPRQGRALDVAGGAGRHALWLAQRGLQVTLVDVSDAALRLAAQRAAEQRVNLHIEQRDLLCEPLPSGPWNLILSVHFLHRPLFPVFASELAPGGMLVVIQPARSNLRRHARPSEAYLLDDFELPSLVPTLDVLEYREGWLEEGRYEAVLVARRPE